MSGMVQSRFGDRLVSRIRPAMEPEYYKTYTMDLPLRTHWRFATCEEYECDDFVNGFVATIDTSTELGRKQYHFLTHDRTRRHSIQRVTETLFKFVYGPGNRCFRNVEGDDRRHKLPNGRPPFYLVAGGDWRGNPRGTPTMIHRRPEDWADDFANHQDKLSEVFRRG
jgi:hypothetical protein